jgi:uncharacterized protein YbcV (DUF1398 family)
MEPDISSASVIDKIREEISDIAARMLAGVTTWEEYVRLVGRAGALSEMADVISTETRNRLSAIGG